MNDLDRYPFGKRKSRFIAGILYSSLLLMILAILITVVYNFGLFGIVVAIGAIGAVYALGYIIDKLNLSPFV